MSALSEARKSWNAAFQISAKSRGLEATTQWSAKVGDLFFFDGSGMVYTQKSPEGGFVTGLGFTAKPWAIDSMLWTTLGGDMGGPRQRTRLRAVGAFAVFGESFGHSSGTTAVDPEIDTARQIDEFIAAADAYEREVPDVRSFIERIEALRAERPDIPHRHRLLLTLALVLDKQTDAAAAIIDAQQPFGGSFSVGDADVWTMLQTALRTRTGIFDPDYTPSY
jgi:hypothetical protein